jgi:hypothetical protein
MPTFNSTLSAAEFGVTRQLPFFTENTNEKTLKSKAFKGFKINNISEGFISSY